MNTKQAIREKLINQGHALSPQIRKYESQKLCQIISGLPVYQKARTVLFYKAFDYEADLSALIKDAFGKNKNVLFPQINKISNQIIPIHISRLSDFEALSIDGKYSKQAVITRSIDMIIVPGVAFTLKGDRLGTGRGYYDRFLVNFKATIPIISASLSYQIVDSLPHDSWDIFIDQVIAPR